MLKRATWTANLLGLLLLSQLAYGADQDAEVVAEPQAAPAQEVQASEQEVEASSVVPADTAAETAQVDAAEETVLPEAPPAQLDVQMEDVKKALSKLKRDLVILEEDLLFPASSQVAVFLSMDVGKFFNLDAVTLKVNGKQVTHHLYTQKQVDALARGGVQKLYVGNVKQGDNRVTAFFTGTGPNGRDFRRATTVDFEKGFEPTFIELAINDATEDYQPDFSADIVN
ncbi:MAG: hypothetical protein AAF529_18905 [Pseudomonadota bacterium]